MKQFRNNHFTTQYKNNSHRHGIKESTKQELHGAPVKVNANFTIIAILEHILKVNKNIREQFNNYNIQLLNPSHYNIMDNLVYGGINITCDDKRLGENTLKIAGKLPVVVLYNKRVSNIKTDLTQADIKALILNNNKYHNICTGAYKGFSKKILADFLGVDYDELIEIAGEETDLWDVPISLHVINKFSDSTKKYFVVPEYLIKSGVINIDSNVGVCKIRGFEPSDAGYPLVINGFQVEYNNFASDKTKEVATFLAKLLIDFFR
jgi:hypothetical protein